MSGTLVSEWTSEDLIKELIRRCDFEITYVEGTDIQAVVEFKRVLQARLDHLRGEGS